MKTKKENLVSIIVPIYNSAAYIERCINSLLNQTYSNIEILLIDDGSTDNSLKIINKYSDIPNIKIISKKNEGVSKTRNRGLKESKGTYITFVDSDDYLDTNVIQNMMNSMTKDIAAINISHRIIQNQKNSEIVSEEYLLSKKEYLDDFIYSEKPIYCWGWLLKAEIAKKIKFDDKTNYMEDTIFILEYLLKSTGKIAKLPNIFYNYIANQESITHSNKYLNQNILSIIYSINKINNLLKDYIDCSILEKYLSIRFLKNIELNTKNLKYKNYNLLFDNETIYRYFSMAKEEKINVRYKIYSQIVLKKNKIELFIYLRIRKITKIIKSLIKK